MTDLRIIPDGDLHHDSHAQRLSDHRLGTARSVTESGRRQWLCGQVSRRTRFCRCKTANYL